MDIGLSGDMDGIETAKRIKIDHEVPVVFIAAQSDDEVIQRAQDSDPYGFIILPFNTAMIAATLATALHVYDLEQKRDVTGATGSR